MDPNALIQAAMLAYVLMQFTDAILKPVNVLVNTWLRSYTLAPDEAREAHAQAVNMLIDLWPLYVTGAVAGSLAWFANLNVLSGWFPGSLGRVLTCVGIGLGPSFVHDLKPKMPEVVVAIQGVQPPAEECGKEQKTCLH